jgi:cellulose synthase/poly-beta-1,6-N-acetylglucosamine synthase-like glycosyltransferase
VISFLQILQAIPNFYLLFLWLIALLLIGNYFFAWIKIANFHSKNFISPETQLYNEKMPNISVLIPFRNESHRIIPLLNSIQKIDFEGHIEFLFIDDHSTDNSIAAIKHHPIFQSNNCKIIILKEGYNGKKDALKTGISEASNEIIVTTDADCELMSSTLKTLTSAFVKSNANLGIGPVVFNTTQFSIHQFYQKCENTALIALGFYQFAQHKPTMANGANLIFKKSIFLELNPFENNKTIAGGDDIFTLEAFYKYNPNKVISIKDPNAAVSTNVLTNLSELWNQRIRWVKKTAFQTTSNTEKSQKNLALFFIFFWVLTSITWYYSCYEILLLLWFGKIVADTIILKKIFHCFKQPISIFEIILSSIFQNFFIPILGLAHPFSKTNWKQRIYS